MGIYNSLRELAGSWKDAKVRQFQGTPQTKVDSAGGISDYNFEGQNATRKELEEVKEIRESGGVISYLVHAKALMQFGTGAEFQTENEDLREWLREELPNYDNMLIELGEDAIWYPYSIAEIVETQGGSFSHIEPVEPWTMEPVENEYGEVIAWEQKIGRETTTFNPGELASIILNKSSGRDNTGISEVLRAEEEIRGFKENRQTVNKALEFLVPHNHWVVGKESGQVIDDNELRRVRNMVDDMEGDTQFITGPDVEQNEISLTEFDYSSIQERDLREVALALGLPLELANIGSDGLGSGMPADLRLTLFERQARAAQRSLTNQVDDELIRPIIEEYSPYPVEDFEGTRLSDPIAEREENSLSDIAPYLTLNEIREELDKPPEEDTEKGDSYRKPANIEAPEEEDQGGFGGGGGFFSDGRALQSVPDNANPIDSPGECDGQVVEGPRGGLYCVPQGEDGDGDSGDVDAELPDDPDAPDSVDVSNAVDVTNFGDSDIEGGRHADDMRIVETADGDHVFMTEGMDSEAIDRALDGANAMRQAGANVPEHYYYEETGELAVEGVNGQTVAEAENVDTDSLRENVATAVAFGNVDMNPGNIIIDETGDAHIIDTEDTAVMFDPDQNAREAVEFALPTVEQHGIDADEFIQEVKEQAESIRYTDPMYEAPDNHPIGWFADLSVDEIKSEVGL